MLDFQFMNPDFNIKDNPNFNDIYGLIDISQYLDFAISQTIHKQLPNVTKEQEKYYATMILNNYMSGDDGAFTSQYGIRGNIREIGRNKIQSLLLKTLIEKDEYNKRVLHKLNSSDFKDNCAEYINHIINNGRLDEQIDWVINNIPIFIDIYIQEVYGLSIENKRHSEQLCRESYFSNQSLEQLNLEMSLSRLK